VLILGILGPTFAVIALGVILRRTEFVSPGFFREGNRVVYWFGLPALLLNELASSPFAVSGSARRMFGAMLAATAVLIAASYVAARLLRLPAGAAGTFVQGAFRGNLAFVGLPIIDSLPEIQAPGGASVRAITVMAIAPMLVIYNAVGVIVLLASQKDSHRWAPRPLLRQILTTPPLVATVVGIAYGATGWPWPRLLSQTCDSLAQLALPLALLGIGGALASLRLAGAWLAPLAAALFKTCLAPTLAWTCGRWVGLGALEIKLIMILLATPTAILSYAKVVELEGSPALASGSIVFSTLLSIVALAVIVML
jgi:predicted permease